jgi:hypothetical protein
VPSIAYNNCVKRGLGLVAMQSDAIQVISEQVSLDFHTVLFTAVNRLYTGVDGVAVFHSLHSPVALNKEKDSASVKEDILYHQV